MDRLALIRHTKSEIYLDPNEGDFGVSATLLRNIRYHADGRRRTISEGELECQQCVAIGRTSTSVYLRQRNDKLEIVHHGAQGEGLCRSPESDEHKAWKDRTAEISERHGYRAVIESGTKRRRTDVIVHGARGLLGWEIQLSEVGAGPVALRTNTAVRDGITPSWLTTHHRAPWINKVPWSTANEAPWRRIRDDRALRIAGGVAAFQLRPCREFRVCPAPPKGRVVVDCGKRHTAWEPLRIFADEFIAKTAAGLYVPLAILGVDGRSVMRRWVSPEDRERYTETTGHPCTESELPRGLQIGSKRCPADGRSSHQEDSELHKDRQRQPDQRPRSKQKRGTGVGVDPVIPVATTAPEAPGQDESPRPEANSRLGTVRPKPSGLSCTHYMGSEGRYCGVTPARPFQNGRYCDDHVVYSRA